MTKKGYYLKRILTGILTAAMIVSTVPDAAIVVNAEEVIVEASNEEEIAEASNEEEVVEEILNEDNSNDSVSDEIMADAEEVFDDATLDDEEVVPDVNEDQNAEKLGASTPATFTLTPTNYHYYVYFKTNVTSENQYSTVGDSAENEWKLYVSYTGADAEDFVEYTGSNNTLGYGKSAEIETTLDAVTGDFYWGYFEPKIDISTGNHANVWYYLAVTNKTTNAVVAKSNVCTNKGMIEGISGSSGYKGIAILKYKNDSLTEYTQITDENPLILHVGEDVRLGVGFIKSNGTIVKADDAMSFLNGSVSWEENVPYYNRDGVITGVAYNNIYITDYMYDGDDSPRGVLWFHAKAVPDYADDQYDGMAYILADAQDDKTAGRYRLSIPVKVLAAVEGETYYQKPQLLITTSQEDFNQKVRDMLREHKSDANTPYSILAPQNVVFSWNLIDDFNEEREGMKPYEGDYQKYMIGSRTESSFHIVDMVTQEELYVGGELYKKITFKVPQIMTLEEEAAIDSKVNTLLTTTLASAAGSSSNETKAKAAFDYITGHVSGYVKPDNSNSTRCKPVNHTPYMALINGYGTCEAFALAYYRLCREMGVPCRVICGTDYAAHAYNIVKLDDGYWYYADTSAGIWKKTYNQFSRATEQDQYRTADFVNNYISRIKGYSDNLHGYIEVYVTEDGNTEMLEQADTLLGARSIIFDHATTKGYSNSSSVKYKILLKENLTSTSSDDLNYISYIDPETRNNIKKDVSGLVEIDLNGKTLTVKQNAQLICLADKIYNGTISMGSSSMTYLEAGDTVLNYYMDGSGAIKGDKREVFENVTFKGGKNSGLYISSGVKVDETCVVTSIPYVYFSAGSIVNCDISAEWIDMYMVLDGARAINGGDIDLGGNINAKYAVIRSSYGLYDVATPTYGFASDNALRIYGNLSVTTATKVYWLSEIQIFGSFTTSGTMTVVDMSGLDASGNWGNIAPVSDGFDSDFLGKPMAIRIMNVKDESGDTVSTGKFNVSGTMNLYNIGDWKTAYPACKAPIAIVPTSVSATGTETTTLFIPGDEVISSFNAKFIDYKHGSSQIALSEENVNDYLTVPYDTSKLCKLSVSDGKIFVDADHKTLTFDCNGGYSDIESKNIYLDQEYGLLPTPAKPKYTFLGWYTTKEGGEKVDSSRKTPSDAAAFTDVTVYAHWEMAEQAPAPEITVAYNPGKVDMMGAYPVGTLVKLSSDLNGSTIWYTTDGTSPLTESGTIKETANKYTDLINLDTYKNAEYGVTIKAVSVVADYRISEVATQTYTLIDTSDNWGDIVDDDQATINKLAIGVGVLSSNSVDTKMEAVDRDNTLWFAFVDKAAENKAIDQSQDIYKQGQNAIFTYTGGSIAPQIRVYYGKTRLKEKTDYTIKYVNNKVAAEYNSAKAPTIKITPKGNFAGPAVNATFTINPIDISEVAINDSFAVDDISMAYTAGKTYKPAAILIRNGKKLTNKDFKVEWSTISYTGAMTSELDSSIEWSQEPVSAPSGVTETNANKFYWMKVSGIGNYAGSRYAKFYLSEKTQMSTVSIGKIPAQLMADWVNADTDGITPEITVIPKKGLTIEGSDYTINYSNNKTAGTATVTVNATDNGNYVGSKSATFRINGYPISKVAITGIDKSYEYKGSFYIPAGPVNNNSNPGTAVLKYTVSKGTQPLTLTKGVDYEVSYNENVNVGTASVVFTGKGKYTGTKKVTFRITPYQATTTDAQKKLIVVIENKDDITYVKGGVAPKVRVFFDPNPDGSGNPTYGSLELQEGKDYTIKHVNNKSVAVAGAVNAKGKDISPQVQITGKNLFKGKLSAVQYTIKQASISDMAMTAVDKVVSAKSGAAFATPEITDPNTMKNLKLAAGTDYEKTFTYTYAEDIQLKTYVDKKTVKTTVRKKNDTVEKGDVVPAGAVIKVTVKGCNNYKDTISTLYRVTASNVAKVNFVVADQKYTGRPITLIKGFYGADALPANAITAYTGSKKAPVAFDDYEIVSYVANTNKGTATVTVKGTGEYGGTKTVKFKIVSATWYK